MILYRNNQNQTCTQSQDMSSTVIGGDCKQGVENLLRVSNLISQQQFVPQLQEEPFLTTTAGEALP